MANSDEPDITLQQLVRRQNEDKVYLNEQMSRMQQQMSSMQSQLGSFQQQASSMQQQLGQLQLAVSGTFNVQQVHHGQWLNCTPMEPSTDNLPLVGFRLPQAIPRWVEDRAGAVIPAGEYLFCCIELAFPTH